MKKENLRDKKRSAEIIGVFAKHNFYVNGFTPEELRTTLEDMGPTYVKIGQIMSSRTDMLPESYCKALEQLRSDVKPLEASVAREVIEQETGKRIDEIYSEFRDKPLGSASIAQAHYGVLKDGTRVVTKVQRPLIAEMMRKDFVLLKKLAGVVNIAGEANKGGNMVDLKSVIEELEKVTEEELDFRVEAENTRKFKELCIEDDTKISCPTIIDELTTERILTMTFVDGYSIAKKDRVDAEGYDRSEIGKTIVENYLHQVLDVGTFHGDPHQGNIMLSGGVPYWIDFGMIGHISEQSINTIQDIILSLLQKDTEALTTAALSLGISNGKVNKEKLTDDIDSFIDKYGSVKNITDIDAGAVMTDLTELMGAHNLTMPGEFTMLVRSLATIEGVLEQFCPELNLFDFLTKKLMARFKESVDIRAKLTGALEEMAATGLKTVKIPVMIADLLKNASKGRMKINFELTGYEELVTKLSALAKNVIFAVFACVLFAGSCTLYTTNIQPQTNGVPVVALLGFVLSISIAVYTVIGMIKQNKK